MCIVFRFRLEFKNINVQCTKHRIISIPKIKFWNSTWKNMTYDGQLMQEYCFHLHIWDTRFNELHSDMFKCQEITYFLYHTVHWFRYSTVIVRRAGLLWSQQDFEWRWSVPLFKCLTVLEFSFLLFDLCLLITFFNFIMNYVPIVAFWIFTYHKIWILSIMLFYMKLLNYLIFSMFGSVLESCELTGVCLLLPWLIKWK